MAEESLKKKTIKGVGWSAIDAFSGKGVTFLVGIVLARLLSPAEYGLIGICVIVNSILDGFVDSGFGSSLIRKKDVSNDDYNTMFITNFVISIIIYGALYWCTPYIADFFGQAQLSSLIRVTGLVLLINGLSMVQATMLSKSLNFKAKTKASLASAILSGLLGIFLAYYGYGVWALVFQMVSKSFFNSLCLWCINKWIPSLRYSFESLRYMWGFGWKILLSGLLDRIWLEAYQTVVGKFYSPSSLGQYTRSKEFASIFSQNLNVIVMRVSYPVLANVQDNQERMVGIYRKIIKQTMFVTSICMISLAAVSEPLIYTLIGEKWHVASTFLPLICISMSLYPLHAINLNMLKVMGRSDLFLIYEILKKIIAVIPIALGIFVGIYWMLVGTIFCGILSFFINSWYTGKKLNYSSFMQIKDISTSYVIACIVAITIYFFKFLPWANPIILIVQILMAVIMVMSICEFFKIEEYMEIKKIMRQFLKKIKKG